MQAQPQSNLAARIPSPPASPLSPITPRSAALPAPSLAESSGLAHDAGNLLAALGLYSELLSLPGVLRPEHRHYAAELRLISDRSSQLIQRLLAAPTIGIDAAPPPISSDVTPLLTRQLLHRPTTRTSDLLAATSNHAATLPRLAPILDRIAAGAATVTVTSPASLPPLNFPCETIERITVNLVRNAAEAIRLQRASASSANLPPAGQILVTLAVIADRLQLTVADNGPGMTPANVAAHLRPLPLPPEANHGLGHRIVHELATASQGQLSIQVRPGRGTTFCLNWPIPSPASTEPGSSDVLSAAPTA